MKSVFIDWLNILANSPKELTRVYEAYAIGATRDGGVIFWQVDVNMKVRTGKIMHYGVDGKRTGNPNWVHTKTHLQQNYTRRLDSQSMLLWRASAQRQYTYRLYRGK